MIDEWDLSAAVDSLSFQLEETERLRAELQAAQQALAELDEERRAAVIERDRIQFERDLAEDRLAEAEERIDELSAEFAEVTRQLEMLVAALAPFPMWVGGSELQVGDSWRWAIQLSGCGWDHLGSYNGVDWFVTSASFEPGDYPAHWPVNAVLYHSGPLDEMNAVVTIADGQTIEATTLWGAPLATYEPTGEDAPSCGDWPRDNRSSRWTLMSRLAILGSWVIVDRRFCSCSCWC